MIDVYPHDVTATATFDGVAAPGRALRAVIYARVSSDPRQQLRSVSQQVDECTAECERRGWTIVKVFTDNDRSASRYATKERPEYEQLISFLRAGESDVLVTWESSRAQRDLGAYVTLRKVAEENGIQWSYKGRLYDLTRTDDRFTTGLDALLDERESSVTRDRIIRDKRAHALKGQPHGRLLFGYRREYDSETGSFVRQVPHEKQAPVVREAAERFAAGESLFAITKDFNLRGLRTGTGSQWTTMTMRQMLLNPAYIAKRVHRGRIIGDAAWPAVLNETTYYVCVQRLRDPGRQFSPDPHARNLLTGIARCGVCGGTMAIRRTEAADKTERAVKYACRGVSANHGKCTVIMRDRMDDYVKTALFARLSRPDVADLLVDERQEEDARAALAEAEEKRTRLEEVYDSVAKGAVSAAALARIEARLLPEIEAAEKRASAPRTAPTARNPITPKIADVWPALPLGRQREIVRALMNVTLLPNVKGARHDPSLRITIEWNGES
ncbi:recombinase family protein [Nocardiopsis sp. FIRDI 009]|uniref:recombinase family protein n=1 Tax=Nocardiopsis sp. FIRDI 009 TaxID=714197 RepID=UPI000E2651D9|nr:recombinase family protein [Nocardiopsis sp. FIRDI 009]